MPSLEQQSRAHKETICTLSDIFVCILCDGGPRPDSLDTDNHGEEGWGQNHNITLSTTLNNSNQPGALKHATTYFKDKNRVDLRAFNEGKWNVNTGITRL